MKKINLNQKMKLLPIILCFLPGSVLGNNIDTETKIYAENVIFSSSNNSSIKSTNVQDALVELSLVFSKVMIGTWDIENKIFESVHTATGKVTIYDNGQFDVTEGSFAAIGEGSDASFCNHTDGTEKYTIITDEVIIFEHKNGAAVNQVIPKVVSLEDDTIILLGSGGCGSVSQQRISILTRE